ncbi:HAMP domain-containing sensor histidine kinase [Methylobacterium sp. 77]|uniref:sensor histidine kinase n=1 Tax=Methylobacterium sp. 77 TaxID=1101192 RepID=UPI00068887F3|nr:HAMP domain-containing sensor histidine kinase [Methylobacterium sp. 77]
MEAPIAVQAETRRGIVRHLGLSGRLFLVTIAFVALVEILIYVPTVANYRRIWLSDRIAAAQIAALVLDASPDQRVSEDLARHLLKGVGARAIAVRGDGTRRLLAVEAMPSEVSGLVDLRSHDWVASIGGAWNTVFTENTAPIRVVGHGRDGFDLVEILIDEAPLREALIDFAGRLLLSSLAIAAAVAGLVFLMLQRIIVRPVRRLARNITEFADDPQGSDRIITPSRRTDEIGHAEVALARMESALANELRQKRRLAELGLSVSKINHELRNLLTTAQLLGDRLETVPDPAVQRIAPRLLATLGRAIRFCEETLAYGRATEAVPQRRKVRLAPLLDEQSDLSRLDDASRVTIRVVCGRDLEVEVDPDQFSRALANIVRNAVQALSADSTRTPDPVIEIRATRQGRFGAGQVTVVISDNGPGLPERARANLFSPFEGSMRAGGTGLGLPIAAELIQFQGGSLTLDQTEDGEGARFRIVIPDRAPSSL